MKVFCRFVRLLASNCVDEHQIRWIIESSNRASLFHYLDWVHGLPFITHWRQFSQIRYQQLLLENVNTENINGYLMRNPSFNIFRRASSHQLVSRLFPPSFSSPSLTNFLENQFKHMASASPHISELFYEDSLPCIA